MRATSGWRGATPRRWPGLCAVCHDWGRGRVCSACRDRFAPTASRCARCALPTASGLASCGTCIAAPPPYAATFARVDYAYPWDRLIPAFKFHGALELAPELAEMIVEARSDRASIDDAPTVVPVPLAATRLRERGYNQAWELARRAARRLGLRADAGLLLRLRETPHQLALPPEARVGNVRDAFAVEPRRLGEVRGRSFAVVDDVMTTGSTVGEIATVLQRAGAARVEVWIVARTPRPGDA
jgi:ComF family protein